MNPFLSLPLPLTPSPLHPHRNCQSRKRRKKKKPFSFTPCPQLLWGWRKNSAAALLMFKTYIEWKKTITCFSFPSFLVSCEKKIKKVSFEKMKVLCVWSNQVPPLHHFKLPTSTQQTLFLLHPFPPPKFDLDISLALVVGTGRKTKVEVLLVEKGGGWGRGGKVTVFQSDAS